MADVEAAGAGEPRETDATVSGQPPAYRSVFKRVQNAKQQSTSNAGFITTLPGIIAGSIGCTICIGLMMALPISMIVMGAIYKDDCPIQRFIPIYLIVGGTVSLFVNAMGMMESVCRHKDPERQRSALMTFGNTCEGFIGCFMIVWFIAGNVWIYSTFGKFTTTPGEATYCDPALYWYAFWITTAGYILLGVVLVATCIILCCVFCCAALCIGRSE